MKSNHQHHHHHHRKDETGEYRKRMERNIRIHKLMPKILFSVTCAIAAILLIVVAYLYTH